MYPAITSRRIPYDIDGTEVGNYTSTGMSLPAAFNMNKFSWLSELDKQKLNAETKLISFTTGSTRASMFWFFFPEKRELTHVGVLWDEMPSNAITVSIQGSDDTTNGADGTWESGIFTFPDINLDYDLWRDSIFPVSFSKPIKVVRIGFYGAFVNTFAHSSVHLYGFKAAGQTPDDIIFTDISGTEITALMDFGDRPEGTTVIKPLRLKNVSTDKVANDVNIQLNHSDFLMSFSQDGPWQAVLDISSISPNSLSSVIYIKNELAPPRLTLGPTAARVITSVGSWT